ncbi:hypothetical protein A6041_06100 [[Haemophilus] ducreyi]|uniref:hypothetical protein n=1 Tax=Haemophilus ducreyi TaxID=730 RepID=UPI0007CDFDE1|nr:hypothetical protein [[Haemophilus] ducreyi]ANF61950.1 hypothetical protein A6037_04005 [[Haemophilus] ducreyi]ANF68132.1 hypothetical protein A6041_06100 [[Haemophilus] ducreyi]ANF69310.1 hypothetical protein A6042_05005 [[Haemophilus] ducreyi]
MKIKYLLAVIFAFFSANLVANSLYLFAQYDGQEISGKSYYPNQSAAADIYVKVYQLGMSGSENVPIISTKSDANGHFYIPVSGDGPFKVVVEGPNGYRAERMADNILKRSLGRSEFELLREDFETFKNKIYLRDIIGGVGYMLGLFGILALLAIRKEKNSK